MYRLNLFPEVSLRFQRIGTEIPPSNEQARPKGSRDAAHFVQFLLRAFEKLSFLLSDSVIVTDIGYSQRKL